MVVLIMKNLVFLLSLSLNEVIEFVREVFIKFVFELLLVAALLGDPE